MLCVSHSLCKGVMGPLCDSHSLYKGGGGGGEGGEGMTIM